jgi:C4-dicarboxylate-specific signal transduction histidine kinase
MTTPSQTEAVERARRLAALRDPLPFIIGGFMHDFRNQFERFCGAYDILRESLERGKETDVKRWLEHMGHAIDDIGSLAGFIEETCKPFYADDASITDTTSPSKLVARLHSQQETKNQAFKWRVAGLRGIPVLSFPPMGLRFILEQLVQNAERASRLVQHNVLLVIRVTYNRKEQMLLIRATDNGPGFTEDAVKRQNETRGDQRYGGLRIIFEIARRMYGWGSLNNRRKGGAVIDIAFQVRASHD